MSSGDPPSGSVLPERSVLSFTEIRSILTTENEHMLQEVVKTIRSSTILEHVTFDGIENDGNERTNRLLREAIFQNQHVKKLSFNQTHVDLQELCHGIRQMQSLESLSLSYCTGIDSADSAAFTRLFRANTKLQEFCLYRTNCGDTVARALADSLRFRSSLRTVSLSDCRLSTPGFISISETLQHHSTLQDLCLFDLHANIPDPQSMSALALGIERNTSLVKLDISFLQILPVSAKILLQSLVSHETLKDVSIGGLQADESVSVAIAELLQGNNTIEKLQLGVFAIEEEGMRNEVVLDIAPVVVALQSSRTLKSFEMYGWSLCARNLQVLRDHSQQNRSLERISLECGIDASAVTLLGRFMGKCSRLNDIALFSEEGMIEMGCGALVAYLKSFQQNHSLETVSLEGCKIGDTGAAALAAFMSDHGTLKSLDVGNNNLSDDGFASIGRALKHCRVLESLGLSGNNIVGDAGIRSVLDGLKENSSLTDVYLPWSKTSRLQREELAFYNARNKGPLPLLSASLPAGLWPRVLSRANKYSVANGFSARLPRQDLLYYLVREKHIELLSFRRQSRKRKRGQN